MNIKPAARISSLAMVLIQIPAGCSDSNTKPQDSNAAQAETATPEFDVAALMKAMASALEAESAVLAKSLRAADSVTDDDRRALWSALIEQERVADQIRDMLKANPTWAESACGWYESAVRKPHMDTVELSARLRQRNRGDGAGGDWWRLVTSAAPSVDATRAHLKAFGESPGSPINLHVMCVKRGFIQDR